MGATPLATERDDSARQERSQPPCSPILLSLFRFAVFRHSRQRTDVLQQTKHHRPDRRGAVSRRRSMTVKPYDPTLKTLVEIEPQ